MSNQTKDPPKTEKPPQGQQGPTTAVQAGQEGNGKPAKRKVGDPVIIALSVCNDALAELTGEQKRRVLDFLNDTYPPPGKVATA